MDLIDIVNKKALIILVLFMSLDVITGLIKAVIKKDVKSSVMRDGILKKILELIIVIVGYGTDFVCSTDIIGNIVLLSFVGSEGISIVENAGVFIPLPKKLKEVLEALREHDGNSNNTK